MTIIIDGTNGVSDVDGTAATPAIRGTDTNTGIFFPAADTIAFSEGGAEIARFDAAGNLGIGTTSNLGSSKLDVRGRVRIGSGNSSGDAEVIWSNYASATTAWVASVRQDVGGANNDLKFLRFDSSGVYQGVAMQLDTSGNLLVGTANVSSNGKQTLFFTGGSSSSRGLITHSSSTAGTAMIGFQNPNGLVGEIISTNSSTAYNTSSDYRLKENVAPMTGALEKVAALKPVTYTWKSDGSAGQGFIAHELQAVVPDCVTGAKDAVETVDDLDAEGRKIGTKEVPRYQGVDTSFLMATVVAALQELKSEFDAYKATHP